MTRETKVGLLAGMALILLIGILVSDHLSVGQPEPAGELIEFATDTQRSLSADESVPAPSMRGFDRSAEPPRELRMPEEITPAVEEPAEVDPQPQTPRVAQALDDPMAQEPTDVVAEAILPAVRAITNEPTELEATRAATFEPIPAARVVPTQRETRYHTAQEALYNIAEKYYGDGNKWPIIQQANKDKVGPDGQVRAGVRLKIPYIDDVAPAQAVMETRTPEPAAAAANAAPQRTIRVEPGQTLSEIAAKHLGSYRRWPEIIDANRDQITRPEQLRADMVLKLPADARAAATTDAAANRPAAIATADSPRTYTVAGGDTLSSIARKMMNDETAWYKLYEANRDKLSSPDNLTVGVELTIPTP